MIFLETKLKGAFIIEMEPREDSRGFFARTFCRNEFEEHGLNPFIAQANGKEMYNSAIADSLRPLNVLEKGDSSRVEKVFFGDNSYVMIFSEDSLMEQVYRITQPWDILDSIPVDSLSVVSEAFVVGDQEKFLYSDKDSFGGWQDTVVKKKYVKRQLFSHYRFTEEHTYCPVTTLPYRVTVRNNVNLTVESPIRKPIETGRYVFFTQVDSSHGRIEGGEMSWVK